MEISGDDEHGLYHDCGSSFMTIYWSKFVKLSLSGKFYCMLIIFHCCCLVAKWCPTLLRHPRTLAHKAPLVHGIFQARILDWVAIFFSRGCSPPRD